MGITVFDAINDALEICSDLGLEMAPGFATHWAMGSETLARLGHPELVHEWATIYRQREHYPLPPRVAAIDERDDHSWRPALGDFDRAGDWQQHFEQRLADEPWGDVLSRWWPRLIPGVSAGLTHGLIRTAHAVRSITGEPGRATPLQVRELASGLAYWAARYVEQPGPNVVTGTARLPTVITQIPRLDPSVKIGVREKGMFGHMPSVSGWVQVVTELTEPAELEKALSDLTLSFVQVNLAHPDQFAVPLLHTVSAPAALRLMLPHLPADVHLPSYVAVWKANAALLATFAPARDDEIAKGSPDGGHPTLTTDELVARAVEHGDEHVLKFTEACLREYRILPDERYLVAAERLPARLPHYFRRGRRKAQAGL